MDALAGVESDSVELSSLRGTTLRTGPLPGPVLRVVPTGFPLGPGRLGPTAAAGPDVKAEITDHFREELRFGLKVFDGGARRTNLEFAAAPTSSGVKLSDIHRMLRSDVTPDQPAGWSGVRN